MLNQLCTVDAAYQESWGRCLCALFTVNGTGEGALDNRSIDFTKLRFGAFVANANDDAIRVKEIQDSSAFSKKLWVGRNRETAL